MQKDVLSVLRLVNPLIDFKKKYAPKALEGDDKGKHIEEQMQTMRIKRYITREEDETSNVDKLYGIVIGQCSEAVLPVLSKYSEYKTKDDECDVIWLLQK